MPVAGRKPKPAGQSVTRHPLQHDWVEVEDKPNAHPHKLPARRVNGETWPRQTRDWWGAVARMPHTRLWRDSDWVYALETAELSARFWADGDTRVATELRNRDKVIGLTWDSRQGLRIKYTKPEAPAPSGDNVARLEDYRNL